MKGFREVYMVLGEKEKYIFFFFVFLFLILVRKKAPSMGGG